MEEYENLDAMQERARELVERWDEEKDHEGPSDPEGESKGTTESSRPAKPGEAGKEGSGPEDERLPAR